jgi:hypothetical protein
MNRSSEYARKANADHQDVVDPKVSHMQRTPKEKIAFYRFQKRKIEEEGTNKKRTFADVKLVSEQEKSDGTDTTDADDYQTFIDFAKDVITLKLCANIGEAEACWKDIIDQGVRPKIWRRGQWLLHKYSGVRVAGVQSDRINTRTTQSQVATCKADVDEFDRMNNETSEKQQQRRENYIAKIHVDDSLTKKINPNMNRDDGEEVDIAVRSNVFRPQVLQQFQARAAADLEEEQEAMAQLETRTAKAVAKAKEPKKKPPLAIMMIELRTHWSQKAAAVDTAILTYQSSMEGEVNAGKVLLESAEPDLVTAATHIHTDFENAMTAMKVNVTEIPSSFAALISWG